MVGVAAQDIVLTEALEELVAVAVELLDQLVAVVV